MKNPLSKHAENFICTTGVKTVSLWKKDQMSQTQLDWLAEEVPVALVYNGISHVVMMASLVDLEFFALGFSLSEGIIESSRETYGIDVVLGCSGIEVRIDLYSRRFMALKARRRQMAGRTGCSHVAVWINSEGDVVGGHEDIGRHVALDKLLGRRSCENWHDGAVLVSSRASYEMVQKAAMCGVEILFAVSVATSLAVQIAERSNVTLVGFSKLGRSTVYTHP